MTIRTSPPILLEKFDETFQISSVVFHLERHTQTSPPGRRMATMLFPLETSMPTAVMMLFVMDFNLLIIFGDRRYSVPIQLALLYECWSWLL